MQRNAGKGESGGAAHAEVVERYALSSLKGNAVGEGARADGTKLVLDAVHLSQGLVHLHFARTGNGRCLWACTVDRSLKVEAAGRLEIHLGGSPCGGERLVLGALVGHLCAL